ncbi:MAG: tRNA (adenosine(37)-N6)-threonylcarbamoyltransferase complex dimerization subunit type 1 TsaB [Bacteroidota bacterium]
MLNDVPQTLCIFGRMSTILCIETATEICSVAVVSETNILSLCENHDGNAHASQLTGLIETALKKAGVTMQQLDAIAVSKGPGSYTGLRVGVSTAKGLCYALNKPLIAIPTLQSLAVQFIQTIQPDTSDLLMPMLDARRMEVYCAGYNSLMEEQRATEAKIIDEESFREELERGKIYFFGNGATKCQATITHRNAHFVADIHCSAKGIHHLAIQALNARKFEDVAYFEPFYLKDFVGTTPRKLV